MLCDCPQERVQFRENEADPLVAFGALSGPDGREQSTFGEFLGQVHAYGGRLGDDGTAIVQYGDLSTGIDFQEPRLATLAAHDIHLDVFARRADFFKRPQRSKRPALPVTV